MATESSVPGKSARLFQLDALRGIGALTVVLYHLELLSEQETRPTALLARFLLRQIAPFRSGHVLLPAERVRAFAIGD
jgi:peptidoglycan/LPS O-acetylase OafA/YrhL